MKALEPDAREAAQAVQNLAQIAGLSGVDQRSVQRILQIRCEEFPGDKVARYALIRQAWTEGQAKAQIARTRGRIFERRPSSIELAQGFVSNFQIDGFSTLHVVDDRWVEFDLERGWVERDLKWLRRELRRYVNACSYERDEQLVRVHVGSNDMRLLENDVESTIDESRRYASDELPRWEPRVSKRTRSYATREWPVAETLSTHNGLLNLRTGDFQMHSPSFLNLQRLPIAWDPEAKAPQAWINFLASITTDASSILLLQEWMGYLLTPDTSRQTALWLLGPTRSGKGTILRIISYLLGSASGATSLEDLGQTFALGAMPGKLHVAIAEGTGGRLKPIVKTRILGIVGEDTVEVNAKHRPLVDRRLSVRFTLATNGAVDLTDEAGALAARFRYFRTEKSFAGKEDRQLDQRLRSELPSILAWCVEGWRRLNEQNAFTEPHYTKKLSRDITLQNMLSDDVRAFLSDAARVTKNDADIVIARDVYLHYRNWCESTGVKPKSQHMFSKMLRRHPDFGAQVQDSRWPVIRQGTKTHRVIKGLALTEL